MELSHFDRRLTCHPLLKAGHRYSIAASQKGGNLLVDCPCEFYISAVPLEADVKLWQMLHLFYVIHELPRNAVTPVGGRIPNFCATFLSTALR